MAQYKNGTVTVTQGSQIVTGVGTLFLANVAPGHLFQAVGDPVFHVVGSVDSDTQITLTANYTRPSGAGKSYIIHTSFSQNLNLPLLERGDANTAALVSRGFSVLDEATGFGTFDTVTTDFIQEKTLGAGVTFLDDVVFQGNISAEGSSIFFNDAIIDLNNDASGAPTEDVGFNVNRGASPTLFMGWRESAGYFEFEGAGVFSGNLNIQNSTAVPGTVAYISDGAPSGLVTPSGVGTLRVEKSAGAGNSAGIAITSGTIGSSFLLFGNNTNDDRSFFKYNNATNVTSLEYSGGNVFSVATDRKMTFTEDATFSGDVTVSGGTGMGGAPNAAYATTIHNSTGAHLRLENDGELGFVNLSDSGNLNLWAHGDTGDSVDILTGSGNGIVRASFSPSMFNVNTNATFTGDIDISDNDIINITTLTGEKTTGSVFLRAGTAVSSGANIIMRGPTHANANDMQLLAGATPWLAWDDSAQNATLSGNLTGALGKTLNWGAAANSIAMIQGTATSLAGMDAQLEIVDTGSQVANKGGGLVLGTGTNRYAGLRGESESGTQAGSLTLFTRPSSGNLLAALTLDSSQNANFSGDVNASGFIQSTADDFQIRIDRGTSEDWFIRHTAADVFALHRNATGDALAFDANLNATFSGNVSLTAPTSGFATLSFAAEEIHGEIRGNNIGVNFGGLDFYTNTNGTLNLALAIDSSQNATFSGDVNAGGTATIGGTPTGTSRGQLDLVGWRTDLDAGVISEITSHNQQAGLDAASIQVWSTGTANQGEVRIYTHDGTTLNHNVTFEFDGTMDLETNDLKRVGKLTVDGGAKISVQNKVDGGSGQGIFLNDTDDTNAGIYLATSGAGKSLADGISCASLDGRIGTHSRFRVFNASSQGWLWENSSESCLMSLTADTGDLYTKGGVYTADGGQAVPSHSFVSDPDSGMYSVAVDVLGFTTGGIRQLSLTAGTADFQGNALTGVSEVQIGAAERIIRDGATGKLGISGGSHQDLGANFVLFGESHATQSHDILLRTGTTNRLHWDSSEGNWDYLGSPIIGVGNVTMSGTQIVRSDNAGIIGISGGDTTGSGANIQLYGSLHPTNANDIFIRADTNDVLTYDSSATTWNFRGTKLTNVGSLSTNSGLITRDITTSTMEVYGSNAVNSGGGLKLYGSTHVTQASDIELTSDGVVKLRYDQSDTAWNYQNVAVKNVNSIELAVNGSIFTDSQNDTLALAGGDAGNAGANIQLRGQTHATEANDILLRSGTTIVARWDDSAGTWDFQGNDIVTTGSVKVDSIPVSRISWFNTDDDATATTPVSHTGHATNTTKLTNDAAGAQTASYDPGSLGDIWDPVTDDFDFSGLQVNDIVEIRIDIVVDTTAANQEVTIQMKFAIGGSFPFTVTVDREFFKSTGVTQLSFPFKFFIGSTDVLNNPAEIHVKSDNDVDVEINGWFSTITQVN